MLQVSVHQSLAAAGLLFSPDSSSSSTPLGHLAAVLANGLLDLLRTSKKRPQIMYSLIINTLLIPQLLCPAKPQTATSVIKRNTHLTQEDLAVLHESTNAPLRRFIQGLLAQGCKGSPRLMLALGLQLGAAVSVNPQVAVWYCDELRQIVMFGGATQGAGGEEMTLVGEADAGPVQPRQYYLHVQGNKILIINSFHIMHLSAAMIRSLQPGFDM